MHVTKGVKKILKNYVLKAYDDFDTIIDKCVEIHGGGWLTPPLVTAMKEISKDTDGLTFIAFGLYQGEELVAGDFGSVCGRIYSSYSGFHTRSNAGNVQMALTAKYLEENGFAFWDLGMPLPYKTVLGAKNLPINEFIKLWRCYRNNPVLSQ
jgi:Leu/Phe-tRNA-protein transferase